MAVTQRTVDALVAFAKNSKLLSLVDRPDLFHLAEHAVVQEVAAGQVIVKQGDPGETFYLLVTGEVSIYVKEVGKEVARLGAGSFFGEVAVVTRQPRSATVTATLPTRLLGFPRAPLVALVLKYPQLREVLGSVGLARIEENLRNALNENPSGLAGSLEGDEPTGLAELLEADEPPVTPESNGTEPDPADWDPTSQFDEEKI